METPEFVFIINMGVESIFPGLISVVHIPLITKGNNAFISKTRNDFSFGFEIKRSLTIGDHFILNGFFGFGNLLSFITWNNKYSFVETKFVNFFFS
jgi:hypothetical protein